MKLNTAAAVISHMAGLEKTSADFYEQWGSRLPRLQETFRNLAGDNHKYATRIRQAYNNAVTDALETAFSFEGLTAEVTLPDLEPSATAPEVLQAALHLESEIQSFYEKAAASSRLLFADVSREMGRMARCRESRRAKIQAAMQSTDTTL